MKNITSLSVGQPVTMGDKKTKVSGKIIAVIIKESGLFYEVASWRENGERVLNLLEPHEVNTAGVEHKTRIGFEPIGDRKE